MALVQSLALFSMLFDHLGAVGLLGDWSRLLGRFALPAFVLMVAWNAWVTLHPDRLLLRLLVLLLVSQPLWSLSVGSWPSLCIMVTLWAVAALVVFYRRRQWVFFLAALSGFLVISPFVEYGAFPLLLVPVAAFPLLGLPLALSWSWFQYDLTIFQFLGFFSVCVILYLFRYPPAVPRLPLWITRPFYPVHLAALLPVVIG